MMNESFAGYFNVSYAPLNDLDGGFASDGAADTYSEKLTSMMGAEFGFLYAISAVSLRFGFEILAPGKLTDVIGSNSGTQAFALKSEAAIYSPKIGIEMNFYTTRYWRIYGGGYAGTASGSLANTYSSVTATPPGDHKVQYKSAAPMTAAVIAYEFHMNDTTTLSLEIGQKNLNFSDWKYAEDVTTFDGSHAKGEAALRADGEPRGLNLSGQFATLGFRFYLM